MRARWKAWSVIVLLIGLAGGAVLTTAAGARRTDTAYARYLRASHAADVLISPENIGRHGFYDAVAQLPEVSSIGTVVGLSAFEAKPNGAQIQLMASTDNRLGHSIERPKIVAGRMARADRPDEVIAERDTAKELGLRVGQHLDLVVAPTTAEGGVDFDHAYPVPLRVVGIGVTRDDVVRVTALAAAPTALATPALFHKVDAYYADKPYRYDSYDGAYVRLHRAASRVVFARKAEDLARQFPEAGAPLFVADEHTQAAKVQHAIRPQATALALFAFLVAIAALFIVGQIASRQLFIAAGENPTLRALGLSQTQLVALHLGEVGIVGAAGALVAVIVAVLASPLMPIGPARLAEPNPGFAADWTILGLGAIAIIVLLLLRLASTAWRLASAHSGVQGTLRVAGDDRPSRILEVAARTGAPPSTTVGVRLALEPGRGRTAVPVRSALAGTALAIAAVAAAFTFGTNLVRLVHTPKLYGQEFDVIADTQFGQLPPKGTSDFLAAHPGVRSWTYGDYVGLTIDGKSETAIGLESGRGPALWPRVIQGRSPATSDELVVGTKTLDALGKKVGDRVSVAPAGESDARPMRIVGRATFPFFGQGGFGTLGLGDGVAMQDPAPPEGNCPPQQPCGFNFVMVKVAPGATRVPTIAALRNELPAARICPQDQECEMTTVRRPVDILNYSRIQSTPLVLAGVLGALALATVAHLLVTSTRRRRRDLAVLKTLGFVRRQVSAAVAWQATTLVALALLVGLPVGIAAGRWVWQLFADQLGVPPDPQLPIAAVVVAIPIALVIANVLAAGPGLVAGRLKPAPVLRTE